MTIQKTRQAVASYMHRATQKLGKQQSPTPLFRLAIRSCPFGDDPKYSNSLTCHTPYPTDDVCLLTNAAMQGLDAIWRDGYKYSKAEVMLMDLRKRGEFTEDLFSPSQPAHSDVLMSVLDQVNRKYGKNALHSGRIPRKPGWAMRREMMSRSFTTDIDQLMRVKS